MKKKLILLVKLAVSVTILTVVVVNARRANPTLFAEFIDRPKNWGLLIAAWALCMTGVLITFLRWYYLVRALELPFRVRDALRLGFLGYMFNFVSLGSVGGDLFKAVFIAREHPRRKAEAISTLIVDRAVGLYALLVMAAAAVLIVGLPTEDPNIRVINDAAVVGSVVGCVLMTLILLPGFSTGPLAEFFSGLPKVGGTFAQLFRAVRMYRRRLDVLIWTCLMSLVNHGLYAIGLFLLATGLAGGDTATLAEHFVIVPLGWVAAALPLPLGALGAFEGAVDYLYAHVPQASLPPGEGLLVALGYRVITVVIATVGIGFFLSSRREVADVWHEAEHELEEMEGQTASAELPEASTANLQQDAK